MRTHAGRGAGEVAAVELDAAQRIAAERLAALLDRRGRPRRGSGGVYLHGPPGRGKTMLMNRFFAAASTKTKRRWHFHEFFALLHGARAGAVDAAVAQLVGDAELICFDEFHVHDIGDAMLVARLLDALFDRRIPLVVTSNYPPPDLLPHPLFHDRFVPTITRITEHMAVVAVDGPRDYRRLRGAAHRATADEPGGTDRSSRTAVVRGQRDSGTAGVGGARVGFSAGRYLVGGAERPGGAEHRGGAERAARATVRVGAREIGVRAAGDGTLVADFADLCAARLSAADYVALVARFENWVILGVPRLRALPPDQVMRWVNLVDVLYDAGRALTVHADAPLAESAAGVAEVAGVADLGRTVSRLYEISHPDEAGAG